MCQSRWKICQILVKCLKIAQKAKSGHTDSHAHLKTFRERRFQNLVKTIRLAILCSTSINRVD